MIHKRHRDDVIVIIDRYKTHVAIQIGGSVFLDAFGRFWRATPKYLTRRQTDRDAAEWFFA